MIGSTRWGCRSRCGECSARRWACQELFTRHYLYQSTFTRQADRIALASHIVYAGRAQHYDYGAISDSRLWYSIDNIWIAHE